MKYSLLIVLVAVVLVGCTPSSVKVRLIVEGPVDMGIVEEFKAHLSSFIMDEQNVVLVDFDTLEDDEKEKEAENKKLVTIVIKTEMDWGAGDRDGDAGIVLAKKTYAPYTLFYETATSASLEDMESEIYATKALADIILPEKALAVEGLYPDDEDYPLFAITRVFFSDLDELHGLEGDAQVEEGLERRAKWAFELAISLRSVYAGRDAAVPVSFITFAGDIMAGRGVEWTFEQKDGVQKVFGSVLPVLQESDLAIGNLEGAITEQQNKVFKSYNFKFPYSVLPRLKEAGFSYLSITNNHSFDYGREGFTDTVANLKKAGIGTSGAGENLAVALVPWQTEIAGTKINVFSLADYPSELYFAGKVETEAKEDVSGVLWPSEVLLETIKQYASDSTQKNFTIVLVHGGFEWQPNPSQRQTELYRKLTAAGADIVVGSHPHVLQPLEVSAENSLIAYSVGNFIFPGMDETEYGEETILLELGLYNGDTKYVNIYPVNLSNIGVSLDTSGIIDERFYDMNAGWNKVESVEVEPENGKSLEL